MLTEEMKANIQKVTAQYPSGTTVICDGMKDPSPIPKGMHGKVEYVDSMGRIHVLWENGRHKVLRPGVDQFHAVKK